MDQLHISVTERRGEASRACSSRVGKTRKKIWLNKRMKCVDERLAVAIHLSYDIGQHRQLDQRTGIEVGHYAMRLRCCDCALHRKYALLTLCRRHDYLSRHNGKPRRKNIFPLTNTLRGACNRLYELPCPHGRLLFIDLWTCQVRRLKVMGRAESRYIVNCDPIVPSDHQLPSAGARLGDLQVDPSSQ